MINSNNIKISVIVPVYNAEKTIKRCVDSIIEQTLENIEIILINDGSTDQSIKILKELQKKDNRVILINKKNEGVSATRNYGLKIARGEFIGFIDSDDIIEKNMFEELYNQINSNLIDIVMCKFKIFYNKNIIKENFFLNTNSHDQLKKEIILNMIGLENEEKFNKLNTIMGSVWRSIYRKDVIINNNILFDNDISYSEDLIFNLKFMTKCKELRVINKYLYKYFIYDTSLSKSFSPNSIIESKKSLSIILKIANENNIDIISDRRLYFAYFRYLISILNNIVNSCSKDKVRLISKLLNDKEFINGLNHIEYRKLNKKNKFYYFIFKSKNKLAIYTYIFIKKIKKILKER